VLPRFGRTGYCLWQRKFCGHYCDKDVIRQSIR
jgi:hypothetical protein